MGLIPLQCFFTAKTTKGAKDCQSDETGVERGFREFRIFFLITATEILPLKSMIGAKRLLPRIAPISRMVVESDRTLPPPLRAPSSSQASLANSVLSVNSVVGTRFIVQGFHRPSSRPIDKWALLAELGLGFTSVAG